MSLPRPDWTDNVLQGLAYWIGYKKQYYRFYPLSEGAIVGEALSLLASNVDMKSMRLDAEIMYKEICDWNNNGRADIVISHKILDKDAPKEKKNGFNYKKQVESIIEVKRYGANSQLIESDFERMADCLKKSEIHDLRCFMLLVSQDGIPKKYVTENGKANRKKYIITNRDNYFVQTRRVCKAVAQFDHKDKKASDSAYYACLIEVTKLDGK